MRSISIKAHRSTIRTVHQLATWPRVWQRAGLKPVRESMLDHHAVYEALIGDWPLRWPHCDEVDFYQGATPSSGEDHLQ